MTSEQIEMAFKQCILEGKCLEDSCPVPDCYGKAICKQELAKRTLRYINRLKAEKEQIRKDTAEEILGDFLAHCDLEIKDSYEQSVKGSKHYGGVNNAYHQTKRIIEHYMERYGIGAKE